MDRQPSRAVIVKAPRRAVPMTALHRRIRIRDARRHVPSLLARRRREVTQSPQRFSANGCPLTTDCRTRHPVPRSGNVGWPNVAFRGLQASVSPAPCAADLGAAFANGPQSCMRRICVDLHVATSPSGRGVSDGSGAYRSEARLLLLLGGDLALGWSLLLRGGFRLRCLLHHVALLVRA